MGDFLSILKEKHKGNFLILILCSLVSSGVSYWTSNHSGWLQEDIELIAEHMLEKKLGLPPGLLDDKNIAEKSKANDKEVVKPNVHR